MTDEIVKKDEAGLATFDAEMAKYAREAAAVEVTGGNFLSFKGGLFVNKQQMKDNKADVIILDSIFVNEHYEGDWDPDNPTSPNCYAFGRSEEDLKAFEKAREKQCDNCAACPLNQWGSGKKGKGKECRNTRRLALIAASSDPASEDIYHAKLSVSQLKDWGAYVKSLAGQYQLPPFGVVTTIQWVPDAKSQYRLKFLMKAPLPREGMDVIMRRVREAREGIQFPFPEFAKPAEQSAEEPSAPKKPKKY